jgi:hypothetical protein
MFSTFRANSESPQRSKARRRRRRNGRASNANSDDRTIAPKASASGRRIGRLWPQTRGWPLQLLWTTYAAGGAGLGSQVSAGKRPSPPRAPRDFGRRRPSGRAENDLSPRRMIVRAVLIVHGGESTLVIRSAVRDPPWGFVIFAEASAQEASRIIPTVRQSGS